MNQNELQTKRGKRAPILEYSESRKYEVIDSEMDQKVIALYAKGMTTGDTWNRKAHHTSAFQ